MKLLEAQGIDEDIVYMRIAEVGMELGKLEDEAIPNYVMALKIRERKGISVSENFIIYQNLGFEILYIIVFMLFIYYII